WYELEKMQEAGYQLLDVRSESEIESLGALKGAINIPVDDLRARVGELSKETPIIVSCQSGLRSYIAERVLKQNGFTVKNLDGAFSLYATVRPEKVVK
ncbi:MAG TPA: rhodanese-like domain-containing protein, partial [Trichococcus flocculiformis]|nr:rhodanese-like domain-containing protein [Trichococcus flocculiformis]